MLNEKKVILMTKLASYENTEGKRNLKIGNYFRSDYISLQLIKSVIFGTIAFLLMFGLYILYDLENFMMDIYKTDLLRFAKDVLLSYAGFIVVYGVITYIVYFVKYRKARKSLKCYYHNLKNLDSRYH